MLTSVLLAVTTVSSAKVALIQRAPFAVREKPAAALGMNSKTTTPAKVTDQEHCRNDKKNTSKSFLSQDKTDSLRYFT